MGVIDVADVGSLALQLAKATMQSWEAKERAADERIYGWKAIAVEVERLRRVPCSVKTVRRWWKSRRFPIDRCVMGYSVRRWELERWLAARPLLPPAT